ncbi:hypothetical protein E2C01_093273 [Portunus trituberculatus]|uniref:Secreted protein n=1 Tax=Portunus trituberculatus TaxID=210409 RepID=A0A5B7JY50_PORTR|nr:hypothetical protein [Portunus trituberculatus]
MPSFLLCLCVAGICQTTDENEEARQGLVVQGLRLQGKGRQDKDEKIRTVWEEGARDHRMEEGVRKDRMGGGSK